MRRLLLLSVALLSGCYTLQAVRGQLEVLAARRPLAEVLADPATDADTGAKLALSAEVRDAARKALGLDPRGSFRSFVRLPRAWPVWTVVVAPELSVAPRRQCFLVVGCLDYRGFFDPADAARYAARARARGDEAFASGVPAYSTLGWFDDPVLWSMLRWDGPTLAEFIAHESAHEAVYRGDDGAFDEAFAEVVGAALVRRAFATPARAAALARWEVDRALGAAHDRALLVARAELAALYASGAAPATQRAAKQARFAALRAELTALARGAGRAELAERWAGAQYDNARLALAATYAELVPGFEALLEESGGDLGAFATRVRALARESAAARRAVLAAAVQRRARSSG